MKPVNYNSIAFQFVFSQLLSRTKKVINNPIIHTIKVFVISTIHLYWCLKNLWFFIYLDNDDTYLVTETPDILNIAMVKIPNITKNNRRPFIRLFFFFFNSKIIIIYFYSNITRIKDLIKKSIWSFKILFLVFFNASNLWGTLNKC